MPTTLKLQGIERARSLTPRAAFGLLAFLCRALIAVSRAPHPA